MSVKATQAFTATIEIDEKLLPQSVREIARLIGLPATLKLVEHYQGVPMWVPVNYDPDHILVRLVGHEAAMKLIEEYGGEKPEIARCAAAIRAIRNHRICTSNKSQRELAIEHGLTVRQIRYIQTGMADDDVQDELF